MGTLDVTTPFDELMELRAVLSAREIAELTGLRRETISRARPGSRFRRRTEKAFADLNAVVRRVRGLIGDDPGQLAAVLNRPQSLLAGHSIADLVREGRVDLVLDRLATPPRTVEERLEDLRFDPAVEAELSALEERDAVPPAAGGAGERGVAALLAADRDLADRLPPIEASIRERFGAGARIERAVVADPTAAGPGHLYLGIRAALAFGAQVARLEALFAEEADLLEPVQGRLTVGTL